MSPLGDSVVLECEVDAFPEPAMHWNRNPDAGSPIIHGGKYAVEKITSPNVSQFHLVFD